MSNGQGYEVAGEVFCRHCVSPMIYAGVISTPKDSLRVLDRNGIPMGLKLLGGSVHMVWSTHGWPKQCFMCDSPI